MAQRSNAGASAASCDQPTRKQRVLRALVKIGPFSLIPEVVAVAVDRWPQDEAALVPA